MKRVFISIILAVTLISTAFTWTESRYGSGYARMDDLIIRESIIDNMEKLAAKSVSRADLADIFDICIILYGEYKYQVHPYFILAIIGVESNLKSSAVSCAGASNGRGLMQVSEIALKDYNISNKTNIKPEELFDPYTNIKVGIWIFIKNIDYGINVHDSASLLSAYNLGAKKVKNGSRNYNYENKVFNFLDVILGRN